VRTHEPEKLFVPGIAEKPHEQARLGAQVAKEGPGRIWVLRKLRRIAFRVATAVFVLDGGLRGHQQHLLWKVDRNL
jgi:hypothetical protein